MSIPPKKELSERDFVHEGYKKNPLPLWLWLFLLTAMMALFWGTNSWYQSKITQEVQESPFLQVSNREFSVFLWQFPQYMRINAKNKNGYLSGFGYQDKVGPELTESENYVVAPPKLIFLYHTWKRLLNSEFDPRPIPINEFKRFLTEMEEWMPKNWPQAPQPYVDFVQSLSEPSAPQNLQGVPETALPHIVRQSFQGWKNYFLEGDAIDLTMPTYAQMHEFLASHPNYTRSFWRNIVADTSPNYLLSFNADIKDPKSFLPTKEMASFLRIGYFNYSKRND